MLPRALNDRIAGSATRSLCSINTIQPIDKADDRRQTLDRPIADAGFSHGPMTRAGSELFGRQNHRRSHARRKRPPRSFRRTGLRDRRPSLPHVNSGMDDRVRLRFRSLRSNLISSYDPPLVSIRRFRAKNPTFAEHFHSSQKTILSARPPLRF